MVKGQYIIWYIAYSVLSINVNASPWVPDVNKFDILISFNQSGSNSINACKSLQQQAELQEQKFHQANQELHAELDHMLQKVQSIHYRALEYAMRNKQTSSSNVQLLSELDIHHLLKDKAGGKLGIEGVHQAESLMQNSSKDLPSVQLNSYTMSELNHSLSTIEQALADPSKISDEFRISLRSALKNSINVMQSIAIITNEDYITLKKAIKRLKHKVVLDIPKIKYPKYYPVSSSSIAMEYGLIPSLSVGCKIDFVTLPDFIKSKNLDVWGVEFFTKYQLYENKSIVIALQPVLALKKTEDIASCNPKDFDYLCEIHILTAYVTHISIAKIVYLAEFGGVIRFGDNSIDEDYLKYNLTQLIELPQGFKIMCQRFGYISQQDWHNNITRDQFAVGKSFIFANNTEVTFLVGGVYRTL